MVLICSVSIIVIYGIELRQPSVKWLLIAEMLDALEEDYRRIYPDDDPPFISFFNKITIFSI